MVGVGGGGFAWVLLVSLHERFVLDLGVETNGF